MAARQLVLFLAVVILPGAVLIGLALRAASQDRALAAQQREEVQRQAAAALGQQLLSRLERLRLAVREAQLRGQSPAERGIALTGRLRGSRVEFLWTWPGSEGAHRVAEPGVLRRARQLEAQGDPARAEPLFQAAAAEATDPGLSALARLGRARVLAQLDRRAEALSEYAELLELPATVRDGDGIPAAYYAADRLLAEWPDQEAAVRRRLTSALAAPGPLAPLEAYLLRDLASVMDASNGAAGELVERADRKVALAEQALALRRELPGLVGIAARRAPDGEPVWVPYGDPLWLVTVDPLPETPDSLVIVVDAGELAASMAGAGETGSGDAPVLTSGDAGQPLAAGLPGLRVRLPYPPADAAHSYLLVFLLPLVLGVSGLTAWLLWRDVQRNVAAVNARSQFVASVTHELKTPLTSIRMFAETLERNPERDPERTREFLHTIVGEAERLSRLINNVLDFSRIEQGDMAYRLEPLDVEETVRQAVRAMAYPMEQQGFALDLQVSDELPPVHGDRDALEQAVINLLANAIKFSGDSRRIEIGVTRTDGYVGIAVTDRGIGVAAGEQEAIFREFYRSRSHERHGIVGAGLGLPIVRHVARAHGGDVTLQSETGVGSTFTLRLPVEAKS